MKKYEYKELVNPKVYYDENAKHMVVQSDSGDYENYINQMEFTIDKYRTLFFENTSNSKTEFVGDGIHKHKIFDFKDDNSIEITDSKSKLTVEDDNIKLENIDNIYGLPEYTISDISTILKDDLSSVLDIINVIDRIIDHLTDNEVIDSKDILDSLTVQPRIIYLLSKGCNEDKILKLNKLKFYYEGMRDEFLKQAINLYNEINNTNIQSYKENDLKGKCYDADGYLVAIDGKPVDGADLLLYRDTQNGFKKAKKVTDEYIEMLNYTDKIMKEIQQMNKELSDNTHSI